LQQTWMLLESAGLRIRSVRVLPHQAWGPGAQGY
jgi:hypothetical protein